MPTRLAFSLRLLPELPSRLRPLPSPRPINSFRRSLPLPQGPPLAPAPSPGSRPDEERGYRLGPPTARPGRTSEPELGPLPRPAPGTRGFSGKPGAKGRGCDLGRLQLGWGSSPSTSPPDGPGHIPARKRAARPPPPLSLLGLPDSGRKA